MVDDMLDDIEFLKNTHSEIHMCLIKLNRLNEDIRTRFTAKIDGFNKVEAEMERYANEEEERLNSD